MSKGGGRVPAESDVDGRVMALEQTARGLNARLCAIERSYAQERLPREIKADSPAAWAEQLSITVPGGDDFVPAAGTCTAYEQTWETGNSSDVQHTPVLPVEGGNLASRRSLSLDIAGLAAGVILVLVSVLLYTGNTEILKNPVVPFVFGVLLIVCVAARRHYG